MGTIHCGNNEFDSYGRYSEFGSRVGTTHCGNETMGSDCGGYNEFDTTHCGNEGWPEVNEQRNEVGMTWGLGLNVGSDGNRRLDEVATVDQRGVDVRSVLNGNDTTSNFHLCRVCNVLLITMHVAA